MSSTNKDSEANKELLFKQTLLASSDIQIIAILEELRSSGDLFIVKPLINELYNSSRSEKFKLSILDFFNDIKDQRVVPIIAELIRDRINEVETTRLIATCWQSRLDYSSEIDLFVDLLINGGYSASIEASSVIETTMDFMNTDEINKLASNIRSQVKRVSPDKIRLVEETLRMIDNYEINREADI